MCLYHHVFMPSVQGCTFCTGSSVYIIWGPAGWASIAGNLYLCVCSLLCAASAGLCCCCFCGFKPVWWCYSPADLGASACVSMYCAETCAALNVHGCMRCNGVLGVMQSMSCAQVAKPVCCRLPPDPCGWGPLERCPV